MKLHNHSAVEVKKSEVITILEANSNSDKNIADIIHVNVRMTHTTKGKLNISWGILQCSIRVTLL